MPRPQQLLYPQREPTTPLPAATLLWVRNDAQGRLQVLMTRRSAQASFAPGAYVFPGGGIDPDDHTTHPLATRRPTQSDAHLTQALAALRESFEELGVIRVLGPDGQAVQPEALSACTGTRPFGRNWRLWAGRQMQPPCTCLPTGPPTATCHAVLRCPFGWA